MRTAGSIAGEESSEVAHPLPGRAHKRKPPIPLRPLHRMWRRTLDEIEIVRVALPVRRLPAGLSGAIACQISDFHVDRDEDLHRLEQAVRAINRQRPDLVFLTGDYFSGPETMRRYLDGFRRALAELTPAAGVFAIAGNHDHWSSFGAISEALQRAGARVLANESVRLHLRGEKIVIVGIDDLWSRRAEPARAFRAVSPNDCSIVLAHNPDTALYARHLAAGRDALRAYARRRGADPALRLADQVNATDRQGLLCGVKSLRRVLYLHQPRVGDLLGAHPDQLPAGGLAFPTDSTGRRRRR